jgi:hypothetical protein
MPESVTIDDAQYAIDIVRAICTEVGPGIPGSFQERERAAYIQKELESHLGAENVAVEEFSLAPDAFLGSQLISTICMVIATLLNISIWRNTGISLWVTAASFSFSFISVSLFISEFLLGFEMLDLFFKKSKSVNVIGRLRKPGTTNAKRLLILSGHHDSALEFTWLRFTGYGFFILTITWMIGLVTVLVMSLIQLIGVITGNADLVRIGTMGWVLIAYPIVPSIIFALFYARGRKNGGTVPGAADNLSACALAVAMCRFLVKNSAYIPDEIEIRFISFGSEEAGMRGSRRYVARHLDELKLLDARLLNFETITHPEITILSSEVNGTVKNSPEMVGRVIAAAQNARIPYKVQQMVEFYHQEWDRPEILTIEPLVNVLRLTFEWIRNGGK